MITRCKKCNYCEYFDKYDEFGIRLKLKDQRCECGGRFEKMRLVQWSDSVYMNHSAKLFEYMPTGEFRDYKPSLTNNSKQ
jgi:hypothetical protein